MHKCAFCVLNFLWLFHLYSRSSSTNEYLLFTIKESDEKSLFLKLTSCKSSQPELYISVSTFCLTTRIIHPVLLETGAPPPLKKIWYQSHIVVPFLLQIVWFDCRGWSNIILSISKNEILISEKHYSSFGANHHMIFLQR